MNSSEGVDESLRPKQKSFLLSSFILSTLIDQLNYQYTCSINVKVSNSSLLLKLTLPLKRCYDSFK